MNVFLSAGEASGDAYASALISEMRRLSPDAKLTGLKPPVRKWSPILRNGALSAS